MSKIKILPENLANKIAAGEVVQRPESVVKELMENALDANSQKIELIIKNAGKTLIQVVDDGEGMSQEDAVLSIQRHATSKIIEIADLDNILTYGFRGEALSAICAVSQLELKTERKSDDIGTHIKYDDQNQLVLEKGSFSKGTSIIVKNLFYNTPARRNFLKTNATELKHIIETFKKISLSHPDRSFVFINDDDELFNFPATDFEGRMKQVFADNILDALIDVKELTDYISLYGYISKPSYLTKSKGEQYLFVNKRFVLSKQINFAVFAAFDHLLEKGDYPFFVLFLDIQPQKIDINVHPSKLEIKFDNEKEIYSFVVSVIKKSLGSYDLIPSVQIQTEADSIGKLKFDRSSGTPKYDFSDRPVFPDQRPQVKSYSDTEIDQLFEGFSKRIDTVRPPIPLDNPLIDDNSRAVLNRNQNKNEFIPGSDSSFIIQLHNKYILSQIKSGLMIIDQHVAHERILYEKALKSLTTNLPFTQPLLFSQTIEFDAADFELLKELNPHLSKLGFALKFFSKYTIVIDGIPPDVKFGAEVDTLKELLDEYKINEREKHLEVTDNIAKSFSCKSAIKAGDKLTEQEMRILIDNLFATSMPYVCPHGRPIIIKIQLEELDKRFGRT